MKILITGDFVINQAYDPSLISNNVQELFAQSDYNIVNLEAPVTTSTVKILKTGPHLKSDRESTEMVLKSLNINMCTLANNHILDYDEQGVLDTLEFCHNNGIGTVGAGKNEDEASKVYFLETGEHRIGIINIAENEWSSATSTTAGANGMDLIDDVKLIQDANHQCDFLFIIVHGGHEYYNLPSPRMQKQYRFYIDHGADLVVGHHPHCISGMEKYKGKAIYYSLGNFLFTQSSYFDDWYKGIVLKVQITDQREIQPRPVFVKQSHDGFGLSFISGTELHNIVKRFERYTQTIQDDLGPHWSKFLSAQSKLYQNQWSANVFIRNKYVRYLMNKFGIRLSSKKGLAILLNLMRCEAHADLSKDTLRKHLKL